MTSHTARGYFSIIEAAAECPQRPALLLGQQLFTFSDLADRVRTCMNSIASRVRAAGATPAPIAYVAQEGLEAIVCTYALFELGLPAIPINARLGQRERQALLDQLGGRALFLDEHRALADEQRTRADDARTQDAALPMALLFTSGTAATPKGVELSRQAFAAAAEMSAANLGWNDDDRWLLTMSLAHIGGMSVLTRCLAARSCMVVAEHSHGSMHVERLAETLESSKVTLISMVPTILRRFLDLAPSWRPPQRLRAILLGGAAASDELLSIARSRRVPVLTSYGMTEACSQLATQNPGSSWVGCGHPLAGVELRIVDGEIHARSPSLLSAYWTFGKRSVPLDQEGFFATGDFGHLDADGNLHVLDRRTDLIVTGGENVAPVEVEQVLERCPGIAAACVFGTPDAKWEQLVSAVVVPTVNQAPPSDALLARTLCAELAVFKRPRLIAFTTVIPTLGSGKPSRRHVRETFQGALRSIDLHAHERPAQGLDAALCARKSRRVLQFDDLLEPMYAAFKSKSDFRIGIELESFGVDACDGTPIRYSGHRSAAHVLALLAGTGGDLIRESAGGPAIGLQRGSAAITLEPGCQLEFSGSPVIDLHHVGSELDDFRAGLAPIADALGIRLLALGFHPFAQSKDFEFVPKLRYEVMKHYLPTRGARGLDMMLRTATAQVNLDFSDERDAMGKLGLALRVAPVVGTMFANSPFYEGGLAGGLSERNRVWTDVDPDRSGLLGRLWHSEARLTDYVNWALDVPMFMFKRHGRCVANTGQTFRCFLSDGFEGERATLEDWEAHLNTLYPDARLRRTLEVRTADAQSAQMTLALAAFWVGLMYDDAAYSRATELTLGWSATDLGESRATAWQRGLDTPVSGQPMRVYAEQLVELSREGLGRRARGLGAARDESVYLEPLVALLARGRSPAEQLLHDTNGLASRCLHACDLLRPRASVPLTANNPPAIVDSEH